MAIGDKQLKNTIRLYIYEACRAGKRDREGEKANREAKKSRGETIKKRATKKKAGEKPITIVLQDGTEIPITSLGQKKN